MWKQIWEAVNGRKTYIILAILAALSFYNGTAGSLDVSALLANHELLEQELVLALVAAGRSALGKLVPAG